VETTKRSSGGQDTKQRLQRLTGGEKPELGVPEPTGRPPHPFVAPVARPSYRAKRITAVVPPTSQSAGSSSSLARAREPAQDSLQNSRPPTPKPQPQSSTNTANLQCCCSRPTSGTHQECLRPAEATLSHLPGPHCATTAPPPALREWAGGQSGPRTNRTPQLPLPSSPPAPAASACPA